MSSKPKHTHDETSEEPRYRVTASQIVYIDGVLRSPGATYESVGWPPAAGVEPINEAARRVMKFKKQHFAEPVCGRQTSPFARKYGKIFLPHIGTNPVDAASVPDHAPRYSSPHGAEFQSGDVGPGRVFVFLAWPAPGWKAENGAARLVLEWLEAHGGDPRMEQSPWNSFDDTLVLPDLPPIKDPRMIATDIRPYEESPLMKEIEAHVNRPRRGRRRTAA